jgi:uncharacterized protein YciI
MFIISLTYVQPFEEVERHLEAHIAYLDRHFTGGAFLAAGRKVPRTGGVILARGDDRGAVEALVAEDPFLVEGIAEAEITEVQVTRAADGLALTGI